MPLLGPRIATLFALVCLAMAVTVGTRAAPAFAHNRLKASSPADGAQLTAAPVEVSLTFVETVDPRFVRLAVSGPDKANASSGTPDVVDAVVRQRVAVTTSGKYVVDYRVVATDGHPVAGTVTFTVTLPAQQGPPGAGVTGSTPPATAAPADLAQRAQPSRPARWPYAVLPVVVLALLGGILLARRAEGAGKADLAGPGLSGPSAPAGESSASSPSGASSASGSTG